MLAAKRDYFVVGNVVYVDFLGDRAAPLSDEQWVRIGDLMAPVLDRLERGDVQAIAQALVEPDAPSPARAQRRNRAHSPGRQHRGGVYRKPPGDYHGREPRVEFGVVFGD